MGALPGHYLRAVVQILGCRYGPAQNAGIMTDRGQSYPRLADR